MIECIVKAKASNELYAFKGNDKFQNITKGGEGRLKKEDATKLFVIPIQLNNMFQKNPLVLDLISAGMFSLEPYTQDEINNIELSLKDKITWQH
jgi:hypothetical protein